MLLDEQNRNSNSQDADKIGKGIWFFILFDFILFAALFAYRFFSGADFPTEFSDARNQLLLSFGFVNTIVIITGGFSIGLSKLYYANNNRFLSLLFVYLTFFLAMLFIANRLIDCSYLAEKGYLLANDSFKDLPIALATFFKTYFYIYSLFMFHVVVGVYLLVRLLFGITKNIDKEINGKRLSFITIYWNYLTLVWMVAFPILFLI